MSTAHPRGAPLVEDEKATSSAVVTSRSYQIEVAVSGIQNPRTTSREVREAMTPSKYELWMVRFLREVWGSKEPQPMEED